MPVDSMSMRALIGIVQALLIPGNCSALSISAVSVSTVTPGRHWSSGLRLMMVSNISTGAGSVAVAPNILMLAVHLAHITKQLRMGCGFNIAPMWHPLRLAEDFATADILTKGRVVFGVGRGYHTREVETFGAPMLDADANRDLFEEQVDIVMKAFNSESFSHQGKHYTLPPAVPYRGYELKEITLVPRPLRQPVECWQPVVSAGARGLDYMMKHRIKGLIGGGAATMAEKSIFAFRDAAERAGLDYKLGEGLSLGIFYYLPDSRERAVREIPPWYEEHVKMFGPLGFVPGITPSQLAASTKRG